MRILKASIVMAMTAQGAAAAAAMPGLHMDRTPAADRAGTAWHTVDARSYHHCHNMPRRIRCHSSERLPTNWPPNSSTPARSSRTDRHAAKQENCVGRLWCWRTPR